MSVATRKTPPPADESDPGGDGGGEGGDRLDRLESKLDRLADAVASLVSVGGDGGDDSDDGETDSSDARKARRPAFSTREIELGAELMMEKAQRRLREMDPPKPSETKTEKADPEVAPVKTPFLRKLLWGEEVK